MAAFPVRGAGPFSRRALFAFTFLAWLIALAGCSSSQALSAVEAESDETVVALRIDPQVPTQINLGHLPASRRIEREFVIENRCGERVKIARMKTSCECLTFEGIEVPVDPRETARATLVVDLRDDPDS